MTFSELLRIEFIKMKRAKIILLLLMFPILVVIHGIETLCAHFSPKYTDAWAAMFIQSALVYTYYLLPLFMIIVCNMIAGREISNNGIRKMLVLPIHRYQLSLAKFCVLVCYLLLEMLMFLLVFVINGKIATYTAGITEII